MIEINFDSSRPIYKQIVEGILSQIKTGTLKPGDRLPTERELSAKLNIARGTVKKAYGELADNNIIEVIQGSGSYVYSESDSYNMEYRRLALEMMGELIEKLSLWELSSKEISALFRMTMAKKDQSGGGVRIAVIDCNPETLSQFKKQLSYIPGITLSLIMVDSLLLDDNPGRLLSDFDLLLTTVTHYEQVQKSLQGLQIRLLPVDMSPSRQTIVGLSNLPDTGVGILCASNKFAYLITEQISLLTGKNRTFPMHFETDLASSLKFMRRYKTIIAAPTLLIFDMAAQEVEDYLAKGGKIIPFDYHIDKASLIHVEEHVDSLLRGRTTE